MKLIVEIRDDVEPSFEVVDGKKVMTVDATFITLKREGTGLPNSEKKISVRVGETKPCVRCGKEKKPEEYYVADRNTTGYQPRCIVCYKKGRKNDKDEQE